MTLEYAREQATSLLASRCRSDEESPAANASILFEDVADVRLHDLRHNFASHAVLNGVPLPTVSRLLGHRQVSMTLRYAHVADREIEVAAERIGEAISGLLGTSAGG